MKHQNLSQFFKRSARIPCALIGLFPGVILAHPGHNHPDETDEFDFLTSMFFHSHGLIDYGVAAVAVTSLAVVCFHAKSSVRIAALVAAAGSIALLPVL